MLSEISQSRKGKYCKFHLHEASKVVKFTKTGSINRMVVIRGWGWGEGELFGGHKVSDLHDEKVLEMCFTTMHVLNTAKLYT